MWVWRFYPSCTCMWFTFISVPDHVWFTQDLIISCRNFIFIEIEEDPFFETWEVQFISSLIKEEIFIKKDIRNESWNACHHFLEIPAKRLKYKRMWETQSFRWFDTSLIDRFKSLQRIFHFISQRKQIERILPSFLSSLISHSSNLYFPSAWISQKPFFFVS